MAKQPDMRQSAKESLERSAQAIQSSNGGTGIPGVGLMQTRSPYSTAVQVIKERDLNKVVQKCLIEAEIAGESFYYAWKQGGSTIEGLSIGAALSVARNFGNCAVECTVQETPESYIFNGCFIDLETGYNLVRPFRQNKRSPVKKDGTPIYDGDRAIDVLFQIGASKAIRNAVLNAVPQWITDRVMQEAKKNVVAIIEKMGVVKARDMLVKKISALGIALESVEVRYGRNQSWEIEQCVQIRSALKAIEDGVESAEDLFPKRVEGAKAEVVDEKKKESNEYTRLAEKIPAITSKDDVVRAQHAIEVAATSGQIDAKQKSELTNMLDVKEASLAPATDTKLTEERIAALRLKVLTPIEFNHELEKVGFGEFKDKLWKDVPELLLHKIVNSSDDEVRRNRAYTTLKRMRLI